MKRKYRWTRKKNAKRMKLNTSLPIKAALKLDASGPVKPTGLVLTSLANAIKKYPVLKSLRNKKNQSNRLMYELRMSLFVASASHPNPETSLQPFPPCFINQKTTTKYFTRLDTEIGKIPAFRNIADSTKLEPLTWELLNWILTNPLTLEPVVTSIPDKMKQLEISTGLENLPVPNNTNVYFFNITAAEPRLDFAAAKNSYGSKFAFHGSSVRNSHSILNRGLLCALNVGSVYGHGTYMSSTLNVSKAYALPAPGWTHSSFGNVMRCVLVVEVVMSPETRVINFGNDSTYYVCDNDDHMQLAHLIVYRN